MKRPLWILNSFLILFILFTLLFMVVSQQRVPPREDIEPPEGARPIKEAALKINIRKIYEDDLFGTYEKEFPMPSEPSLVGPFPKPPRPKMAVMPEEPKPEFFDPLNITLKGITIIVNNSSKNRAIIADNKTNTERIYREGDTLEDAQLVRILSNKIIFLRSNGQQEVLYLREKDAQNDPSYRAIGDWDDVVQKTDGNAYLVSLTTFIERVKNLALFIDMLDITTVYKKGVSVGCRIGQLEEKSLAHSLGLQTGDIVLDVTGIPTTSAANRVTIYNKVKEMQDGDAIKVVLQRNNQKMSRHYTLKEFRQGKEKEKLVQKDSEMVQQEVTPQELRTEQKKLLEQKYKFAPTVQELRARERKNMFQKGRQKNITPITE